MLTPTLWSVFHISDDSFVLDSTFELLFSIRPQSPAGLLLHVGVFNRSHYLSVYMLRGEVRPDPAAERKSCTQNRVYREIGYLLSERDIYQPQDTQDRGGTQKVAISHSL